VRLNHCSNAANEGVDVIGSIAGALENARPNVRATFAVDQLNIDAKAVLVSSQAAFENVVYGMLGCEPREVGDGAGAEARASSHDREGLESSQGGGEIFYKPIALTLRASFECLERDDRQRRHMFNVGFDFSRCLKSVT
jgi:hypothetical protein